MLWLRKPLTDVYACSDIFKYSMSRQSKGNLFFFSRKLFRKNHFREACSQAKRVQSELEIVFIISWFGFRVILDSAKKKVWNLFETNLNAEKQKGLVICFLIAWSFICMEVKFQEKKNIGVNQERKSPYNRSINQLIGNVKVVLWRKSHLSDLSHFKTQKSNLYKKQNAVYYFQISLFVPEIFEFLKYAN